MFNIEQKNYLLLSHRPRNRSNGPTQGIEIVPGPVLSIELFTQFPEHLTHTGINFVNCIGQEKLF